MSEIQSPLGCVCVYGRYGVGKTLFGLSSPFKPILVLDNEFGAKLYRTQFEFEWVDCSSPEKMSEAVHQITKSEEEYGTILVDTVSQYEDWAKEFIWAHAKSWEIEKQTALLWGRTKDLLRSRILELMSRCKVLVLTAHSRTEWVGNRPTGKLEAKALEPIWDLADVVAFLEREVNRRLPHGTVQPPYGKSRILALPPRVSPFTWAELLRYINEQPADWDHLRPEQQAEAAYQILEKLSKIEEPLPE